MWWVDRLTELHIQNFHVIKDLKRMTSVIVLTSCVCVSVTLSYPCPQSTEGPFNLSTTNRGTISLSNRGTISFVHSQQRDHFLVQQRDHRQQRDHFLVQQRDHFLCPQPTEGPFPCVGAWIADNVTPTIMKDLLLEDDWIKAVDNDSNESTAYIR